MTRSVSFTKLWKSEAAMVAMQKNISVQNMCDITCWDFCSSHTLVSYYTWLKDSLPVGRLSLAFFLFFFFLLIFRSRTTQTLRFKRNLRVKRFCQNLQGNMENELYKELIHSSIKRSACNWNLEIFWTNLHLGPLDWLIDSPLHPGHCFMAALAVEVQAIEIWVVAISVPPSTFIRRGTVGWPTIIITIFGGKWSATVIRERITSSS